MQKLENQKRRTQNYEIRRRRRGGGRMQKNEESMAVVTQL
jgi:hypothetical protein